MKTMNRTLLLSLLSRCRQLLEDAGMEVGERRVNATVSSSSSSPATSSSREAYDNAYFYILVVMVFYSFLAMTLLKCLGGDEERKDPYHEFIRSGQTSTQKLNAGHMVQFYFEEESSL